MPRNDIDYFALTFAVILEKGLRQHTVANVTLPKPTTIQVVVAGKTYTMEVKERD